MVGQKRLLRRLSVRGAESDRPKVCIRGLERRCAIWSTGILRRHCCAGLRGKRPGYNEACIPRFKLNWIADRERGWRCWSGNWDGRLPKRFEKGCAFWKRPVCAGRNWASSVWESFVLVFRTWGQTKSICGNSDGRPEHSVSKSKIENRHQRRPHT